MESRTTSGFGKQVPPDLKHVKIYFSQQLFSERRAIDFFCSQQNRGWLGKKGRPIRNWKTLAANWIWNILENDPYIRSKHFQRIEKS